MTAREKATRLIQRRFSDIAISGATGVPRRTVEYMRQQAGLHPARHHDDSIQRARASLFKSDMVHLEDGMDAKFDGLLKILEGIRKELTLIRQGMERQSPPGLPRKGGKDAMPEQGDPSLANRLKMLMAQQTGCEPHEKELRDAIGREIEILMRRYEESKRATTQPVSALLSPTSWPES